VGRASKKLHAKLSEGGLSDLPTGKMPSRPGMPDMKAWIREGMDPIHAAYAFVQHITSFFAKGTSQLPEMKKYAHIVAKAEDEYLLIGDNHFSPLATIRLPQLALRRRQLDFPSWRFAGDN
jgi:hypothetical protein